MGVKERLRWSAERTVSKAREGFSSVIHRKEDDAEIVSAEPVPDTVEPVIDTEPSEEKCQTDVCENIIEERAVIVEPITRHIPAAVPLVKRANRFKRSIGASSRKIDIDDAPLGLTFVGFVALVFASLYLMKLLSSLETMQEDMSILKRVVSAGMLLFLFYQYIGYVITIFQLKSGMRGAWAAMVRSSGSYVILMLLAETHIFDWLPFNLVSFPSWALMLCMTSVMVYMMMPFVREYYKPAYAEMVPLTSWILFLFWIDPYDSAEELGKDIDVEIDI